MAFDEDLIIGEQNEQRFWEAMREHLDIISITKPEQHELKDFDVKMAVVTDSGVVEVLYEVKTDVMADETGNYAIERTCYGNPSGLHATKAHFFVIIDKDDAHIFRVGDLKNHCNRLYKQEKYRSVMGGDDNAAEIFLYKCEDILECEHKTIQL